MSTGYTIAEDRFVRADLAAVLKSAAPLTGGALHFWSPRLRLAAGPRPGAPEESARLRALAGRAAVHRRLASEALDDGRILLACPVHGRSGLAGVLTLAHASGEPARTRAPAGIASMEPAETAGRFLGDFARLVARHLDLAAETAATAARLADCRAEVDLLHRIARCQSGNLEHRETMQFILDECRLATGADFALLDVTPWRMLLVTPRTVSGGPLPHPESAARRIAERLTERSAGSRHRRRSTAEAVADLEPRHPEGILEGEAARLLGGRPALPTGARLACARLGAAGWGHLCLVRFDGRAFTPSTLRLLQAVAEQAALAARAADARHANEDFLLSTVRALVSTIEAKDRYTLGHSTRVHLLSMMLGKGIGMDGEELGCLKWASLLHDVGKIGMPEAILNKPGRLTEDEFCIVRRHSQRGYQVLNNIPQLQEASQAVLLHHERFGGGGYPLGISGEGIPRAARVIAVADTYDALTSRRPYRGPRTPDEALEEIRRVRGSQLDPQVVDVLETVLPFMKENLVLADAETGDQNGAEISSAIGK